MTTLRVKALLRFNVVDQDGWQWFVMYGEPPRPHYDSGVEFEANQPVPRREGSKPVVMYADLVGAARDKVNDRQHRFSWLDDGRRSIEDRKVWLTLQAKDVHAASDIEHGTSDQDAAISKWEVVDIDLYAA